MYNWRWITGKIENGYKILEKVALTKYYTVISLKMAKILL
jgi:hypothetical protein